MVFNRSLGLLSSGLLLLPALYSSSSIAADIGYSVGYGARYENNVLLDDATKDGGLIHALNLSFTADEFEATWFDADFGYAAEITQPGGSLTDVLEEEENIEGDGRMAFTILPNHLSFRVFHHVERVLEDSRAEDIANNRELRNFLALGPDLEFTPSSADTLGLFVRYARIFVAGSDPRGAEKLQSQASWVHELSAVSSFSLLAEYEESEQEQTREAILGGYASRLRTLDYAIYVGVNTLETFVTVDGREVSADAEEPNIRINLTKQFTSNSLEITAFKELADTLFGVSSLVADTFVPTASNIDAYDIIDRERLAVELASDAGVPSRLQYRAELFYEKQDYQTLSRDEEAYGLLLNLSYAVMRNGNLVLDYERREAAFQEQPEVNLAARDDSIDVIELALEMQFGARLLFRVYSLFDSRSSTLAGEEYENFGAGAEILYRY